MYSLLKNNLSEAFYGLLEFFPIIILFLSTVFLMLVGRITSNKMPTRKIIIILKIRRGCFLPTSASVYSGTCSQMAMVMEITRCPRVPPLGAKNSKGM